MIYYYAVKQITLADFIRVNYILRSFSMVVQRMVVGKDQLLGTLDKLLEVPMVLPLLFHLFLL